MPDLAANSTLPPCCRRRSVGCPQAQGRGIGKILLTHCLRAAQQKQITTLILYSNTILESAIHLYRKYVFEEIDLESGLYERANIKMQKHL
jgi:ribosomal protein S18 acetylase RimI-like enzyme